MKKKLISIILSITFCYAQNTCDVGTLQCCQSVQNVNSPEVQSLLGLLGIVAGDIKGQVGINCNPVSVIGVGGNSCTAQPACCTNNNFNGLVALNCKPVNANL